MPIYLANDAVVIEPRTMSSMALPSRRGGVIQEHQHQLVRSGQSGNAFFSAKEPAKIAENGEQVNPFLSS